MLTQSPRRCERCGCRLSQYNSGTRCSACLRSRDMPPATPSVPERVWRNVDVQQALAAWDFSQVARLIRQHGSLRQDDVAQLTGLSQAFLSMLEAGRRRLTNIDKIAEFLSGLGVPPEISPLPLARRAQPPIRRDTGETLTEGPGHLLLPGGRNLAPTLLPALTRSVVSFRGNTLCLTPDTDTEAWSRMPLRALLATSHTVDGTQRHFVMDTRQGDRHQAGGALVIPTAYELDDLTYGILWAVAGFDSAILGDDTALHDLLAPPPQPSLADNGTLPARAGLADGSKMLVGSQMCASFILEQRDALADDPVFWSREQRGEEAATWLIFQHKHRYLQEMAPRRAHSGVGRAFCVPRSEITASPMYERVLLFLALALMESYGVTTWLTDEPDLQQTDGFVLVPGHRAAIATWVRAEPSPQTALAAAAPTLRTLTDLTGHAQAHTITAGSTPGQRLAATADYLGLDRPWLTRRCRQLAAVGTTGLARPRSRHLSLDALDIACSYVAAELQPEAGGHPVESR